MLSKFKPLDYSITVTCSNTPSAVSLLSEIIKQIMDFTFHSNGKLSGTFWGINDYRHNMSFNCFHLKEKHVGFALSSSIFRMDVANNTSQFADAQMWFPWLSIQNGFILLLLQKLSLNLFTSKKRFQSCYSDLIMLELMICYDASYLVFDNPLQTNGKPLLHLLQKALWQLLQLVCTDLCK